MSCGRESARALLVFEIIQRKTGKRFTLRGCDSK
jgi:hypothetical protein